MYATMETFIEGVRLHPCLWNPTHPEYREVHVKDEAWQRVVDRFNHKSIPNIQVAKTEWKKLRDNHRDALKRAKLGKNKLLPAQITTWKYAKAMQFLEPHMKYRITENIELELPPGASGLRNSEHDVTTTDNVDNILISGPAPKKRCVECKDVRNEGEALESFFNCILQTTKTMPLWMQTQVKKKIFAVIIEAEELLSGQEQAQSVTKCDHQDELVPTEQKIKTEIFNDDSCENEH